MTNTNDEYTHVKGALPFEVNRGFTQIPNAILRHYQYYPQLNGAATVIYGVILSHYNKAFGYAFPTHIQVALATNISEKTVGKHIKTLESAGLIAVLKKGRFGNDQYTFNSPIEVAEEFFAKYPEAGERYRKLEATLNKSKSEKDVRKAEMVAPVIAEDDVEVSAEDEDITSWL